MRDLLLSPHRAKKQILKQHPEHLRKDSILLT